MKITLIATLVAVLYSGLSFAEGSRYYLGIGYGSANYKGGKTQDILLDPGQRLSDNTDFLQLYGGYRFNDQLSIEVGYSEFDKLNKTYALNPLIVSIVAPNNLEQVELSKWSLGGVFEYPITGKFKLTVLLGYSFFDLDRQMTGGFSPSQADFGVYSSDSDDGIYYGVGVKYLFNHTFAARFQWIEETPNDFDLNGGQLALEMQF